MPQAYKKYSPQNEINPEYRSEINDFLVPLRKEAKWDIWTFFERVKGAQFTEEVYKQVALWESKKWYEILSITDELWNFLAYGDGMPILDFRKNCHHKEWERKLIKNYHETNMYLVTNSSKTHMCLSKRLGNVSGWQFWWENSQKDVQKMLLQERLKEHIYAQSLIESFSSQDATKNQVNYAREIVLDTDDFSTFALWDLAKGSEVTWLAVDNIIKDLKNKNVPLPSEYIFFLIRWLWKEWYISSDQQESFVAHITKNSNFSYFRFQENQHIIDTLEHTPAQSKKWATWCIWSLRHDITEGNKKEDTAGKVLKTNEDPLSPEALAWEGFTPQKVEIMKQMGLKKEALMVYFPITILRDVQTAQLVCAEMWLDFPDQETIDEYTSQVKELLEGGTKAEDVLIDIPGYPHLVIAEGAATRSKGDMSSAHLNHIVYDPNNPSRETLNRAYDKHFNLLEKIVHRANSQKYKWKYHIVISHRTFDEQFKVQSEKRKSYAVSTSSHPWDFLMVWVNSDGHIIPIKWKWATFMFSTTDTASYQQEVAAFQYLEEHNIKLFSEKYDVRAQLNIINSFFDKDSPQARRALAVLIHSPVVRVSSFALTKLMQYGNWDVVRDFLLPKLQADRSYVDTIISLVVDPALEVDKQAVLLSILLTCITTLWRDEQLSEIKWQLIRVWSAALLEVCDGFMKR